MLAGLLQLAGASVQLREAGVAVGDEGAHAELFGKRHGLAVVVLGLRGVGRIATRGDLAEAVDDLGLRVVANYYLGVVLFNAGDLRRAADALRGVIVLVKGAPPGERFGLAGLVLTGRDWMIPRLQRRYRGYFSPYLQDKIPAAGRRRAARQDSGKR